MLINRLIQRPKSAKLELLCTASQQIITYIKYMSYQSQKQISLKSDQ